jgi:AraC-like DNA-binding protein
METVSYVALTQTLFAIILLASKRPKWIQDRILIVMLAVIAWIITGSLFRSANVGNGFFTNFNLAPFSIALMPLLYLYVRTSINENPRFRKQDPLHFALPVVFLLVSILVPNMYGVEERMYNAPAVELGSLLTGGMSLAYVAFYIVIIFRKIRKHQKELPNLFSFTSSRITFNWIKIVILLFIFNWVVSGLVMMINISVQAQVINPGIVFFGNLTLFSFAISYFGFFQPSIFFDPRNSGLIPNPKQETGPHANVQPLSEPGDDKAKYKKSNLTEEKAGDYLKRIVQLLEKEELYLKPDLTIQEISEKLDVPKHYLTESLNTYMGKNFYTLINEYRIQEFKTLAADEKNSHLTLLALAYDSGFNSKSAFNLVFKKQTGETPSQFLKTIRANQIDA